MAAKLTLLVFFLGLFCHTHVHGTILNNAKPTSGIHSVILVIYTLFYNLSNTSHTELVIPLSITLHGPVLITCGLYMMCVINSYNLLHHAMYIGAHLYLPYEYRMIPSYSVIFGGQFYDTASGTNHNNALFCQASGGYTGGRW